MHVKCVAHACEVCKLEHHYQAVGRMPGDVAGWAGGNRKDIQPSDSGDVVGKWRKEDNGGMSWLSYYYRLRKKQVLL